MKLINYFVKGFNIQAFIAGLVMTYITYRLILPRFNFEIENSFYNLQEHPNIAIFSTVLAFYLVAYTFIKREEKKQNKKRRNGFIILTPSIILGFIFACIMVLCFISVYIYHLSPVLMIIAILYTVDEGRKKTKSCLKNERIIKSHFN